MDTITIPAEIQQTLDRLRREIRRYVLWEGLATVVVVMGVIFWATFGFDWIYFQLSKFELPRWFRALCLIGMVSILVGAFISWILLRLFRSLRSQALALVLERRFPQLDDRLITVVEAAERGTASTAPATTRYLLQRTVQELSQTIGRLDLATVFDPRPLRRALVLAAVSIVSVLGLFVLDSAAMDRWFAGYWGLRDNYWPRETELVVKVLAQPGDRLKEFVDGLYRHPKGTDLLLRVEVPEGRRVPEQVRLDYQLADGREKGRTYLVRGTDGTFRHVMPGLLDDMQLYVTGGDFTTITPLQVQVVDPPTLTRLNLECRYPEYTNWNSEANPAVRTSIPISGTQVSLPVGTDFQLSGRVAQPLKELRLEGQLATGESFELTLLADPEPSVTLILRNPEVQGEEKRINWAATDSASCLNAARTEFSLPFVLTATPKPSKEKQPTPRVENGRPLPLAADSLLRLSFVDHYDIASLDPARLTVSGIVDQPPLVDAQLTGIGSSITHQARIPIAGVLNDDYGLAKVRFEYQIDDAKEWTPLPIADLTQEVPREYPLALSEREPFVRFDVLPLNLSLKQRLIVTVVAEDGDNLSGPHFGRSQRFAFTIVPVEELQSLLYAKELNLRKRFEQIISEVQTLQQDLSAHRKQVESGAATPEVISAASGSAERSIQAIRKTESELESIELGFTDIRAELVNNAAQTPEMLERLDRKILDPLSVVTGQTWPKLDASLVDVRVAIDKTRPLAPPMDRALQQVSAALLDLNRILVEMRTLETFREMQELLKALISEENNILEETKSKRKANALKALDLE